MLEHHGHVLQETPAAFMFTIRADTQLQDVTFPADRVDSLQRGVLQMRYEGYSGILAISGSSTMRKVITTRLSPLTHKARFSVMEAERAPGSFAVVEVLNVHSVSILYLCKSVFSVESDRH